MGIREDFWGSRRDDDIDLEPDELGRDLGDTLLASLGPAVLDRDGTALDPTEFAQSLHERGDPLAGGRARALAHEPDSLQFPRLLRARRERPRGCRAAEQRDEPAAIGFRAHSITSSASASRLGGISRPSAFAVLRLTANSNLVGCWTGSPLGFSPRRMRSI